ncbi:hypothetical protein LOY97_000285 [Ophidiomyces ophidiicola]|nr:hypothetical protein LOZ49_001270 [Ophidiomyces ophidiicola]KAI2022395.1 hypothetical protein LOZ46_001878 [Ophidiomyces ophidiicola]KAI2055273.1 hypothetical protein LOZ44_002157 [Ophidiomyces ophidiicola]KAI2143342.1 hypothetical protein LOZ29_001100 [Ophidiomyces ophidiicola]KAI2146057.1 hypothetical protein LOZ28_000861 [Ophidiomyces ophidiicola]
MKLGKTHVDEPGENSSHNNDPIVQSDEQNPESYNATVHEAIAVNAKTARQLSLSANAHKNMREKNKAAKQKELMEMGAARNGIKNGGVADKSSPNFGSQFDKTK